MNRRHTLPLALLVSAAIFSGCTSPESAPPTTPLSPHDGPLSDSETLAAIIEGKNRAESAIESAKRAVNAGDLDEALADAEAPEASEADRATATAAVEKASSMNQAIGESVTRLTSQAAALQPGFSIESNRGYESLKALCSQAQKAVSANDEILARANGRLASIKTNGAADDSLNLARAARDSAHGVLNTAEIDTAIKGAEKLRAESEEAVTRARAKAGDTEAYSDARALISKTDDAANTVAATLSSATAANDNLALSIAHARQNFDSVADKTAPKAEAARLALEEAAKTRTENGEFLTFAGNRLSDLKTSSSGLITTLSAPVPVAATPVAPEPTPAAPVAIEPTPVAVAPAPVEPTPVVTPVVTEPTPVETPAPVEPAPVVVIEPTPVAPVAVEPAPVVVVEPTPVEPTPVETPVVVAPAPVVTPAPVVVQPVTPPAETTAPKAVVAPVVVTTKPLSVTERYLTLRRQLTSGKISREEYDRQVKSIAK